MNRIIGTFSFILLLGLVLPINAQITLNGYWQNSFYLWQDAQGNRITDMYHGFWLRFRSKQLPRNYLNTYWRFARRGKPGEIAERVYNLYYFWQPQPEVHIKIGRQFLFYGVMNGVIDGGQLQIAPSSKVRLRLVAGMLAASNRTFHLLKWNEAHAAGGQIALRFSQHFRTEVSFFQKVRQQEAVWRQLGVSLGGKLIPRFGYYVRMDYNLLQKKYQLFRMRLTYLTLPWTLVAEYSSQRPRIYEDSFFSMFKVRAHNQLRLGMYYQLKWAQVGLQYFYTMYGITQIIPGNVSDTDSRVLLTLSGRYGTLGVIYQNGFGGQNVGYFGNIRFPIFWGIKAHLFHSYYNYERTTTRISEDALSFSAGLEYRLKQVAVLQLDVQQASNIYFVKDWRVLTRITFLFRNGY